MTPRSVLGDLLAGRRTVEEVLGILGLPGAGAHDPGPGRSDPPVPVAAADGGAIHVRTDLDRRDRTGVPEVVFAGRKTAGDTIDALRSLSSNGRGALASRVPAGMSAELHRAFPAGLWHERARIFELVDPLRTWLPGRIAVVSAGTSDGDVAEEAAVTAEFLGSRVLRVYDAGVAGLHRILAHRDELSEMPALVVVAGMEGALASVVGGLVPGSVIAVPTSVGYGASFGGIAALLSMLNSCAPGVTVVNIDNGFGAAVAAHRIHRAGSAEGEA